MFIKILFDFKRTNLSELEAGEKMNNKIACEVWSWKAQKKDPKRYMPKAGNTLAHDERHGTALYLFQR